MEQGYMMLVGNVLSVGNLWSAIHRVPSYQNQPICKGCVNEINLRRAEQGMEPLFVPDDAYEPTPEE